VKRSLRNKIIAWSFVPTAMVLVSVALVSLYAYQRVTESLVMDRDRELTRLSARILATELAAYTNPLADQYLAIFDGVIVFDPEGRFVPAEPMLDEGVSTSLLQDLAASQRWNASEPLFSDVIVDQLHGDKLIVAVLPIASDRDGRKGGIAGIFRLGERTDSVLYSSIEKLGRGESSCVYLIDGAGHVIFHSDRDYIGQDFAGQPAVEMAKAGVPGALRTRDGQGREIVASFAPVSGTPWSLVTEESWAALSASSRQYGQLLLLLLGLGIVLPTLIITVGAQRITRPIEELISAAKEIASGHFGQRIQASTGDELEQLARQFNLMASRLQESYAHLERKVADRTRELATLNAIAAEVSHSLDLQEILDNALDEVLNAIQMDTGQAFRLDEENSTLVPMARRGLPKDLPACTDRLPLRDTLAGHAAQQGQPVVWHLGDPLEGEYRDLAGEDLLAVVVSVPLIAQRRPVGAINLGSLQPRAIAPEELALLSAIGQQIGVAVENARLYEQAQQLAVMQERNRLARDLHDSVTQALYGITLYSEAATRQIQAEETGLARAHLADIRTTAQESLREMRLLIYELRRPILRRDGLAAALQARLEAVEARVGMETKFEHEGDQELSPEVEEGLYWIAQEALNNALKHARAGRVAVRLHRNGSQVTLEVADDGTGFDTSRVQEQGGFGLRTMQERAARLGGELAVVTGPGTGTVVRAEVCA
jgi:nitrate/nitrite-specific signal transduction histidine kinase